VSTTILEFASGRFGRIQVETHVGRIARTMEAADQHGAQAFHAPLFT
jgi:endonuclease III